MEYTLWEFLQSNIAAEAKLLTNGADFKNVYIKSISVQELPVDDFIQKDELVLSTAMGCLGDPTSFTALLHAVKNAGAAALLLSFKAPNYVVPPEVIAYANSIGLPMFSIPWNLRFSDVQAAVHEAVKAKRLSVYQNLQTTLFNAFFESKPLSSAAAKISQSLNAPVEIVNASGQVLAQNGSMITDDSEDEEQNVKELEISIAGLLSGYLRIYTFVDDKDKLYLSDNRESLLQKYVCFPLSLWFNRKNIEDLTTLRLKNDFVWDLAHNRDTPQIELLKQGARLHFNLQRPYTCAVLRVLPREHEKQIEEYSSEAATVSVQIEDLLIQSGKNGCPTVMVSSRTLDFIIYIGNPQISPEIATRAFLDRLHHQLTDTFPAYGFYWGISEITLKEPDFPQLYQNAALALQYCIQNGGTQYCFTYRDTKEAQIVSALSSNEKVRQVAEEFLRPLRKHNADSGTDLIETLAAFIHCNYNTSSTARMLHIHRQSLLYRLDKIKDLTGISLDDHKDLFLLEISLRVFSLYS